MGVVAAEKEVPASRLWKGVTIPASAISPRIRTGVRAVGCEELLAQSSSPNRALNHFADVDFGAATPNSFTTRYELSFGGCTNACSKISPGCTGSGPEAEAKSLRCANRAWFPGKSLVGHLPAVLRGRSHPAPEPVTLLRSKE